MKKLPILCIGLIILGMMTRLSAYDSISLVQSPLMNRPAIVRPGESFEIRVGNAASVWTATLSMPYKKNVQLQVSASGLTGGIRTLTATVPVNTPYELYDLTVRNSDGQSDAVIHAVKVIQQYKNEFTLIHLPDAHLPSVAWIGFYDDPNTVPEFVQITKEINLINPEFVLQTGDLVDNGQNETQYQLVQELLEDFKVPIFVTGGNHDLWYNGHEYWHRYFGTSMDYSFVYDDLRFIGLEMYDTPSKTYTADQMLWLQNQLNASINAGEAGRILFTHYDESRQLTGDFVDQYLVDAILYGHTHINGVQLMGLRQALKLNTSFTMNDNGEYRILKIRNGLIEDYPVVKFRRLWSNISPANDGSSWKVQADIHNDLLDKNTGQGVDLEDVLVKLHVKRSAAPFEITGGTEIQFIDYENDKRVYYIETDVAALSTQSVLVRGTPSNEPPRITGYAPHYDTTLYGGASLQFRVQVQDADTPNPSYIWYVDNQPVSGQSGPNYTYQSPLNVQSEVAVRVEVSDGVLSDEQEWNLIIERSTGRPVLKETTPRNFYPYDQPLMLEWVEPIPSNSVFQYGLRPGNYTSEVPENGLNQVTFTPASKGMGLGVYYGRIRTDQGLVSEEFQLVIESSQAPSMLNPLGNITSLSPVFQWEAVQGVPYYFVILTDHEIVIVEDPITGEISVEGANPIWGVLTSETSVPYGASDPSGTFTSFPAPLTPGGDYWWIVLNCYGNAPELTSTVQSGVSQFLMNLPLPNITSPALVSPDHLSVLSDKTIVFRWEPVENATGYHFYPFKVELEEGIEVVRPIWQQVLMTTNTLYEYDAANQLVKGDYIWKVSAVDKEGVEVPSVSRRFTYQAPSASVTFRSYDAKDPSTITDDVALPRVSITYDAISGVDMGLLLSTDRSGSRPNVNFSPGTYTFTATKEGYAPYQDTLSLADGQSITAHFRLVADPALVTGAVQDQFGKPVASARILFQHNLVSTLARRAETGLNGEFTAYMVPGPWMVTASKTGYQTTDPLSITVPPQQLLELSQPIILEKYQNKINGLAVNTSGVPIYGVTVQLQKDAHIENQTTNSNGQFSFNVGNGEWTLTAGKPGFVSPNPQQVSVTGGQEVEIQPNLVLTSQGAVLGGIVWDGTRTISGAEVRAISKSGVTTTAISDQYGHYSITLKTGHYSLSASKEAYSPGEPYEIFLDIGQTVSGVQLLLQPNNGHISGSVTMDGITPVENAQVRFGDLSVLTGNGGYYAMNVPSGIHDVSASKTGFLSDPPRPVILSAGQHIESMNFVLSPNASIVKGIVYNKRTGEALAEAQVFADDGYRASTRAGSDGVFTLNVPSGFYKIYASLINYKSDTLTLEVGEVQKIGSINIPLSQHAAIISGKIVDAGLQSGLMGVLVEVPSIDLATVTDANGAFNFLVPPANSIGHELWLVKRGYETVRLNTGVLIENQTKTVNRSLTRFKAYLEGRITNENGKSVSDAIISASPSGNVALSYVSRSYPDGRYELYLPSTGSPFIIQIEKPGYIFPQAGTRVATQAEGLTSRNFALQSNFAVLTGKVFNEAAGKSQSAVPNATLFWQDGEKTFATMTSDEAGYYAFLDGAGNPFLVEGHYTLRVEKTGFADTLVQNLTLTGGQNAVQDVGLRQYSSALSGIVTNGNAPLVSVSVTIQHESTGKRFSRITDDNGVFQFKNIPAGDFRLRASQAGYSTSGVMIVVAPNSNLNIILIKNIGRIWGVIRDQQTQTPLRSVSVSLKDGHGNETAVSSNVSGLYEAAELPIGFSYNVTASLNGYQTSIKTGVSPTLSIQTDLSLKRIYGSLQGNIIQMGSGAAITGAVVRIKNESGVFQQTVRTDASGVFSVQNLPTDIYYVFAEQPGYLSSPASRRVSLKHGGDSTRIDFSLEAVQLAELSISGPLQAGAGESITYNYVAKTEDGRSMMISPEWSVDLPMAVEILPDGGRLTLKSDFIGPLKIFLADAYSGMIDSVSVQVTHQINPGNPSMQLQNYRGASFILPENCVVQSLKFGLKHPQAGSMKRLLLEYELSGKLYSLTPNGLLLNNAMTFTLPVPQTANGHAQLGEWDRKSLKWLLRDAISQGMGLTYQSALLSQWAVFVSSEDLGIRDLRFEPNPFSPFISPLDISFRPTTRSATHVSISIRIYNIIGDLIRELEIIKIIPKGAVSHFFWDGKTDSGEMALNGRYVIHIRMRDGEGEVKKLAPVVLIK